MKVQIRFFAALRERAGESQVSMDVTEGSTVDDLWEFLGTRYPRLAGLEVKLLYAINEEYVPGTHVLREDDEVAFIPPVSGGFGDVTPDR